MEEKLKGRMKVPVRNSLWGWLGPAQATKASLQHRSNLSLSLSLSLTAIHLSILVSYLPHIYVERLSDFLNTYFLTEFFQLFLLVVSEIYVITENHEFNTIPIEKD